MPSATFRRLRASALVLGSLTLAVGTLAPAAASPVTSAVAAAAPVGSASPTTAVTGTTFSAVPGSAAVAAKKKAKKKTKPARAGRPKLVKGGSRHLNVRISWPWMSGVSHYQVQAGLTKKFTKKGRVKATRKNTRSRPAGGRLELTVAGLQNATRYFVRVRAVAPNGAKGKWSKPRKVKTKVHIPERITSMTATPGPNPGEVTFRWTHKPTYTSYFQLQLASTTFHPKGKGLPKKGRSHLKIKIPATKKSSGVYTISAAQARRAGARMGSGNHLYFRFSAINKGTAGSKTRVLPNLRGVKIQGPAVASSRAAVKASIGSFNLASNKEVAGRGFEARSKDIAKIVVAKKLGIVGLQELSPGRKEDKPRPTERLVRDLEAAGGNYELVRRTPYFKGGSGLKNGSQGARILYDRERYQVQREVTACTDSSQDGEYSDSCAIEMDRAPGEARGRMAAYVQFLDKQTKARFWFVSLHLTPDTTDSNFDELRAKQLTTVLAKMDELNTEGLPMILTGDLNSWQTRAKGNVAQDVLLDAGFVDSFSTLFTVNEDFSTYTRGQTTPHRFGQGFGTRLDYVLTKGALGATRWENVMKVTDAARPSDHNLVLTELLLPAPS